MQDRHRQTITEAMGAAVQSSQPLGGGCVADVRLIQMAGGQKLVAKLGKSGDSLDLEGQMLTALRKTKTVPIPEVFFAADDLLLIDFIDGSERISEAAQIDAAGKIAALHNISQPNFGFNYDTVIGGLHQPNPPRSNWTDFFRDERLLYMAKEGLDAGRLPAATMARIETFAGLLDRWIEEPTSPSLLHGDLWCGNVLCKNGKLVGLIDPAIYYGHAEIELAFSTLFGTFGKSFFDAYNETRPIKPGFFEERLDIYNLYPLLVHVRLFGGSYVGQVEHTLQRFGC